MDLSQINYLAVGVAALSSFLIGGLWYSPILFAKAWMREAGFGEVLQLEGGILGYFEQVGGEGYEGGCFVFDERVALDPTLRPVFPTESVDP